MKKLWEKIKNLFKKKKKKNNTEDILIPDIVDPISDRYLEMLKVYEDRYVQLEIDLITNFIPLDIYENKKEKLLEDIKILKQDYISVIRSLRLPCVEA